MGYEPLLYRPEWKPVINIGDVADVQGPGSHVVIFVEHIEMKPAFVVDWGNVASGATIAAKQALNAQSADVLAVGPDQFAQIRIRLDPRDFLVNPTSGNPTLVQAYQPGPAQQRWSNVFQSYAWDAITQGYNPNLAMTELWSYYNQTPNYAVVNQSGATQTTSRIWFQMIVYTGTQIGSGNPNDPTVLAAAGKSMLKYVAVIPAAVKQTRNQVNNPGFE